MRTDPKQSDENREEAGLEEALKLWVEIRQVDRKKGWERLEAEIGRQYGYADRKGVVVWVTFGG